MIFRFSGTTSNIFLTAFIGFILVVIFASYNLFRPSDNAEPLNDNHKRWLESGYENYRYTIVFACMGVLEYRVVVKNGVKVSPRSIDVFSMNDLFEYANRAEKQAYNYTIEYHETGFPSRIEVDWSKEIIDDECSREVKDFQLIQTHEL